VPQSDFKLLGAACEREGWWQAARRGRAWPPQRQREGISTAGGRGFTQLLAVVFSHIY